MAYDVLIFDLDGTLWDTTQPVTHAWNTVASQDKDLPKINADDIRSVMGLSHEEAFARLLPGVSDSRRDATAREFYDREVKLLRDNYLYPGVREGLDRLSKRFPLFLVSNCQPGYLQKFFELTGLKPLFKDAECYGATLKPKGDNISAILRRNQMRSGAYIGDTAGDQIASRQAGTDYYHVSYGFGSPTQECPSFDSFKELTEFFLGL